MAKQSKQQKLAEEIMQKFTQFAGLDTPPDDVPIAVGTSIPSSAVPGMLFINSVRQMVYQFTDKRGWVAVQAYYWHRDSLDADTASPLRTNVPWLVKHHSPTGMNVGYAGSGPADFALNILEHALRSIHFKGDTTDDAWDKTEIFRLSDELHQACKANFLMTEGSENVGIIGKLELGQWISEQVGKKKSKRRLPSLRKAITPGKPEKGEDLPVEPWPEDGGALPFAHEMIDDEETPDEAG